MTNDPFPTNTTADTINQTIDSAVKSGETLAEKAIETAIETAAPNPFLWPVVKQVEEFAVEELVQYIGKEVSVNLQQFDTFIVIDTQVSGEKKGISQVLANLMSAEKSGDQNAIQAAVAAYQKAQSALVNSDGAATPHT